VGDLRQRNRNNDERARDVDETARLRGRNEPLKGETLDVVVGRNKPTRSQAEQAVEDVRNVEDGQRMAVGSLSQRCR